MDFSNQKLIEDYVQEIFVVIRHLHKLNMRDIKRLLLLKCSSNLVRIVT